MNEIKEITTQELIDLIPETSKSEKFLSWQIVDLSFLNTFDFIGNLKSNNPIAQEYKTSINYWLPDYPIALNYYPNYGAKIYTDNVDFYLVYKEFGGHSPELRCRLLRKSLIIDQEKSL